jgi:hypothetical protein
VAQGMNQYPFLVDHLMLIHYGKPVLIVPKLTRILFMIVEVARHGTK